MSRNGPLLLGAILHPSLWRRKLLTEIGDVPHWYFTALFAFVMAALLIAIGPTDPSTNANGKESYSALASLVHRKTLNERDVRVLGI
jgi:hypothetical protein